MQDVPRTGLVVRFDVESAAALASAAQRTPRDWTGWIDESLRAVAGICDVLNDLNANASFFLVGELLQRAGSDYTALLKGNPRFDIGNHTYSHWGGWRSDHAGCADTLRTELSATADLIEDHFGIVPTGFTGPGGCARGLRGRGALLRVLWEQGYRTVTTDTQEPIACPWRSGLVSPYRYDDEGFPGILEVPLNGWHCNMLFNTAGQNDNWRPALGLPDGAVLEKLPETVEEGFEVRKKEFEYAISQGTVYAPCMHPWSVYRFDPELQHLRWLIQMATDRGIPVLHCRDVYDFCSPFSGAART